jgi:Flp pilus assembly protein CpaB
VPAGYVTTTAAVYADGLTFVRPGDRIDLVAPPAGDAAGAVTDTAATVIAHGVEVLAVRAGRDATADAPVSQVLLAAPRDIAVRIAAHQGAQVLAAVTLPP